MYTVHVRSMIYFYRPQRSWVKVMFLQASVNLLTGGGVCLSACWDARLPQTRQTPRPGRPPWDQADPRTRQTPRDQADTPWDQADPLDQADPPPWTRQTPPSIWSMSGRYASYWNAFLLSLFPPLSKSVSKFNIVFMMNIFMVSEWVSDPFCPSKTPPRLT